MREIRGNPGTRAETLRWMAERLGETERRVAALVARGRTNQEIADALHISAKTVEWNLTKVYRKLGVRSRTELALKLARASRGDEGLGS
jgi:DNA-binding CsgD family transcriptional regulator